MQTLVLTGAVFEDGKEDAVLASLRARCARGLRLKHLALRHLARKGQPTDGFLRNLWALVEDVTLEINGEAA